jgi:hypothetical protein
VNSRRCSKVGSSVKLTKEVHLYIDSMQHREVNLAVQAVTPQKNRHSEPGQYSHDSKQFTWMIQEVQVHVEGSSILCFLWGGNTLY